MSIAALHSLLNGHLATFAAAQSPTLSVAWENRDFKPSPNAVYLRPRLLPATPRAAGLGSDAQDAQPGIYQIDVMGLQGKGWASVAAIADNLRAAFSRGLRLSATGENSTVMVQSVAVGPAMIEDTRYKVPVSVNFIAYMEAE